MATPEQPARAARVLDDLYRRHAAEVFRYTYAVLGNRADAEDVTQATFVNALRALERGEQPRKAANWLLAIAHNLMRQRFRQERARPTQVLLDSDLPQAALTDDDDAPSVGELVRALGRIPVSQREAIVMREFEGRSYTEIAQILGVTTSALETLLFRARRSLAEELENLVTCARAEQDVSRLLDGRLSRRERKRLQEHVESCPACARFEAFQRKQRRALKGLAVVPLPASLVLFKGVHGASAASLPTIGAGTAAAAAGGASGGVTFGGLALGGIATKAAVVLAAVAAAGGVSYEGATHLHTGTQHPTPEQGASNAKPSAHADAAARKAIAVARARQAVKAHHLSGIRAAKPKAAAHRHSSAKSHGAGVTSGKAAGHGTTPRTGGTSSSHRSAGSTTKTASVQSHQSRPAKSTTTDKQKATTTQPTTPPAGGSAGGTPPNGTQSASSNGKTGTATGSTSTDTSTSTPQGGGSANGVTGGAGGGAAKGHGK